MSFPSIGVMSDHQFRSHLVWNLIDWPIEVSNTELQILKFDTSVTAGEKTNLGWAARFHLGPLTPQTLRGVGTPRHPLRRAHGGATTKEPHIFPWGTCSFTIRRFSYPEMRQREWKSLDNWVTWLSPIRCQAVSPALLGVINPCTI